jgi:DNA sulfur modification protein DndD
VQLTELVLHNVGAYQGRQVIDLTTTAGKPVILIGGLNGCGKTTLLDALQLVLYGNRARLSNRGSQAYEDFLRATISRSVKPEEGASISLTLDVDNEGEPHRYRIVRAWASVGKRIKESLDVSLDGDWNAALSSNWSDHIEDLLPLEIAGLFFFDGEKIEALADPERAATVVQTAVHSLLGISTLEQLRTDLLALQRRQLPASGDTALDQHLADLLEQHARVQETIGAVTERRTRAQVELADGQAAAEKASQAFARDGGDLYERRTALATERASVASQLQSTRSQLRTLAEGALPLALVLPQIHEVIEQAAREDEAKRATQTVSLLRDRDEWILSLLPKPARNTLVTSLQDDRANRTAAAEVTAYLNLTSDDQASVLAIPMSVRGHQETARVLLSVAAECAERLDQLDSQLAGVPADDVVRQAQANLELAKGHVARIEGQLVVLDEDLDRLRSDLEMLEVQLAKVEAERLRTAVADDDVKRILDHSERVRETLVGLREKLIKRHISKIEIATLESFRRLMRKEGLVADLRINPTTYAITLASSSGHEISPSRLSAGERQLLAVALLWGLARVAGNRLPTVIDTPLGRLDSHHRKHLVDRYFPSASGQVILLSTDEEIDEELFDRLSPAIAQTYVLEHDDESQNTVIQPGYWWLPEVPDVA